MEQKINYTPTEPDAIETLTQLQGGVLTGLMTRMLADVAMAAAEFGDSKKKGKLTLQLEITPSKGEGMVNIEHKLTGQFPTGRGKRSEEVGDEQPMYINRKGALTPMPEAQGAFTFDAETGEVVK